MKEAYRRPQAQRASVADRLIVEAVGKLDAALGVGKRGRATVRGKLPHNGGR